MALSYFSQTKGERDMKGFEPAPTAPKFDVAAPARRPSQEIISTLGPGLLITGNVVSTGAVQIYGRVIGDIHAARLIISKGAFVEGKVMVQDAAIEGTFKGTILGNNVKLQATAVVDGEIFKQSLVIEENAQFEGVARRLEKPVEAPTDDQVSGKAAAPIVALVPEQIVSQPAGSVPNGQAYGGNGGAPAAQTFGFSGVANANGRPDTTY
jgi:cytoskeletal protein CcmA (bactofilin family)